MKNDKAVYQHMMTNHNVATASLVTHFSGKQYVAIFWLKNCKRKLTGSKYVATCNTKTIALPPGHTHNKKCRMFWGLLPCFWMKTASVSRNAVSFVTWPKARLIQKTVFSCMKIFNKTVLGIPILIRRILYIERIPYLLHRIHRRQYSTEQRHDIIHL